MKLQQSEQTLVTLANGAELVSLIAQGVIGNEVADTIDGAPITRKTIYALAQTKFQSTLSKYLGSNQ